ncbi:MAG: HAD-IIIC family phosphatase [Proteobacteria bacterium]|nr:HAD-IIIC family phosphatase [Pseudomonadota bacterium]
MRLNVYGSFESPGFDRVLNFWNSQVPLFAGVTVHSPGLLSWGATAEIAPDELRVFLLDPAGLRMILEEGPNGVLRAGSAGRAPIVALFPDAAGKSDPTALGDSRAELLDVSAAAAAAGVHKVFDIESLLIAGVPYTDEVLTVIGTALHRRAHALLAPAPKVLALDCDGTLWQGVCAEVGPNGVHIGPEERWLHAYLAEQKRSGRLLVLVSKNVVEDVEAVFQHRADMGLRWSDIAAVRVGWSKKSEALRELAHELNVALDSFVLIDDSSVECAEVRSACGQVAVLQRPRFGVRRFFAAAWPLDPRSTAAGGLGESRTRLYQDEARRRAALRAAPSFADYIRDLAVRTTVRLASGGEQARLFELAQRTNQFHTAADRPSAQAVAESIAGGSVLAVEVADRFGEYGISGSAFLERTAEALTVKRLMLSCRVLGRGVEEDVFDALVLLARNEGGAYLDIAFAETERNVPARRFLKSIGEALLAVCRSSADGTVTWRFLLDGLSSCPRLRAVDEGADESPEAAGGSSPDWTALAKLTGDSAALAASLGLSPNVAADSSIAADEQGILSVIADVVGRPVSRSDNLYALGCDSLKIVRLLARLKSALALEISIGAILYRADVADLLELARLEKAQSAPADEGFFDRVQSLYDDELPVS